MDTQKLNQRLEDARNEVRRLEREIERVKLTPDWEKLSSEEIERVFQTFHYWNDWDYCPIGSLFPAGKNPNLDDDIIHTLGTLTNLARNNSWRQFIFAIRHIARLRAEEKGYTLVEED